MEAAKRGLPNLRKSPEALAETGQAGCYRVFQSSPGVQRGRSSCPLSRQLERYVKDVEIEIEALKDIAKLRCYQPLISIKR